MNTARIFLSSPGDVGPEREMAAEVFRRLQAEFSGLVKIDPYFWENEPMRAHTDYQGQIEPPSHFDLFVCILWARLGTQLHPSLHQKSGGGEYASGTEYELEDAIEGYKRSHAPEILIYKRTTRPEIKLEPKEERERVLAQYDSLNEFFTQFTQKDGHFVVAINNYTGLEQFERKFESDMRKSWSVSSRKGWPYRAPLQSLGHREARFAACNISTSNTQRFFSPHSCH